MNIFETKRCKVREFLEIDLDIVLEYRNNLNWMKYQGFKNLSVEEYRFSLLAPFNIIEGSQLAIVKKETNKLIGDIYLKREDNVVNIGYTIHPSHSRKGYIKEVILELIVYLNLKYPNCMIRGEMDLDNIPSKNLLVSLGFVCIETTNEGHVFQLEK